MIAKQRVLVVDDEEIVRESFRLALTEAGYSVRTASSGHDALQAVRDEPCDVMLADLKMPDMDGLQVTRAVTSELPGLPVVIITGYPSPETYDQAAELGIVNYLEKPISPERLSAVTATALAHPWSSRTPLAAEPGFTSTTKSSELKMPELTAPELTAPETEADRSVLGETQTDDLVGKAERVPEPAATIETTVVETEEKPETEMSTLKAMGLLALSPIMGLAFVIFLPLIGFGMLFAAVGSVLTDRLGWSQR